MENVIRYVRDEDIEWLIKWYAGLGVRYSMSDAMLGYLLLSE